MSLDDSDHLTANADDIRLTQIRETAFGAICKLSGGLWCERGLAWLRLRIRQLLSPTRRLRMTRLVTLEAKLEEAKLAEAMVEIILKMGLKNLPLLSSRHTFQMMAKAAAVVYEAAAENGRPDPR